EGTISALLRSFPAGAAVDDPELALAHAAVELAQGRLELEFEKAAAQLALAESHVQSAPPARRRRLAVAIASLRLALARRSGRFTEVMEQVNLLDASTADGSRDEIAMGSELRGGALAERYGWEDRPILAPDLPVCNDRDREPARRAPASRHGSRR